MPEISQVRLGLIILCMAPNSKRNRFISCLGFSAILEVGTNWMPKVEARCLIDILYACPRYQKNATSYNLAMKMMNFIFHCDFFIAAQTRSHFFDAYKDVSRDSRVKNRQDASLRRSA